MLPISFQFVAAGAATRLKGNLYKFQPARTGQSPDWDNRGNAITTYDMQLPITDKSWWEGRFALCTLTLEKPDGERLVMNDAVASITRSKNIVTTEIVGRNGSIKEYINDGDYQINLLVGVQAVENGVVVDEYPIEGLQQLKSFLCEPAALNVHSEFFDLFDITRIVVKEFSLAQSTESNYQEVSISAISDEEYNIYSTEY